MSKLGIYLWNLIIWLDQGLNVLLGGDPDETLSSRAGKLVSRERWARYLCLLLNRFDRNHCAEAIEADEGKDAIVR